jgi:hypothetical protein
MRKMVFGFLGMFVCFAVSVGVISPASASAYVPGACQGFNEKVICASKAQHRVLLVKANGTLKRSAKARFGGPRSDGTYFTREGVFRTFLKGVNVWSTSYNVNMPFFQQFSGGQGLHYSADFAAGDPYSHGCIGVKSMRFAQKAYYWAPLGTLLVVTAG